MLYLCYIDESGTSNIPGNTSHFVLAGLSIPIWHWKQYESEIDSIKNKYNLESSEIHSGWILRNYTEQNKISNFSKLDHNTRRQEVERYRKSELLRLQKTPKHRELYKQTKKNYRQTAPYIHLTYPERVSFMEEIAKTIGGWESARLFAECIDKIFFDPRKTNQSVEQQAFEQIVSRFELYLKNISLSTAVKHYGLLIHDSNETVAKKHTELMKSFHNRGTLWTRIDNIIETPLFVNSQLTSMIQLADVCAYSLRRYLENSEVNLYSHIFKRADKKGNTVVGIRHFSQSSCSCKICTAHKTP